MVRAKSRREVRYIFWVIQVNNNKEQQSEQQGRVKGEH